MSWDLSSSPHDQWHTKDLKLSSSSLRPPHINTPKSINHSISWHTLFYGTRDTRTEAECKNKSAKREKGRNTMSDSVYTLIDTCVYSPQSINFKPEKWMSKLSFGLGCVLCSMRLNGERMRVSASVCILFSSVLRVNILSNNIQQWVLATLSDGSVVLCCLLAFFPSLVSIWFTLSVHTPISKMSLATHPHYKIHAHTTYDAIHTRCVLLELLL